MLQRVQSSNPTAQPATRPAAPRHQAPARPATSDRLQLSYGARDASYDQPGGTGPIHRMQQQLQQLGYFQSAHGATGGYFADTREAVRRFQAANGLPATGRADAATLAAIEVKANGAPIPAPAPAPAPAPQRPVATQRPLGNPGALEQISPSQLRELGRNNKPAFFDALRPAAQEVERRTGVPSSVTLAQAALETGFGAHMPAGTSYNLFGHKGVGPAGSVRQASYENHHTRLQVSSFRRYHNFYEAVVDHGEVYEKAYYKRAMANLAAGDRNPRTFLKNIEGIYHNDGREYTNAAMSIINRYNLNQG